MRVNIAVLNYNGKALLEECLPSIIEAAARSRFSPKVTVLDNCSTDGSIEFLRNNFPQVDIYMAKVNRIYCSYNELFRNSEDDVILILNSDIKVDVNFLDPMVEHFERSKEVFFVSSRMYFFDKVTYQGDRAKAREHFGIISADTRFRGYEKLVEKQGYTFSTGNGAFDRRKFLELGGFDTIYLPGRYEDVDLCFRGWKSGYKGIYEPRSIIYHKGYVSFKAAFSDKEIQATVFRNSLIFMVKNISSFTIFAKFCFWLPIRLIYFILSGRPYFVNAAAQAFKMLPLALRLRDACSKDFKLTDKEVVTFFNE